MKWSTAKRKKAAMNETDTRPAELGAYQDQAVRDAIQAHFKEHPVTDDEALGRVAESGDDHQDELDDAVGTEEDWTATSDEFVSSTFEETEAATEALRKRIEGLEEQPSVEASFIGIMQPPGMETGQPLDAKQYFVVHKDTVQMFLDGLVENDDLFEQVRGLRKGMKTINRKRQRETVQARRVARKLAQARSSRDRYQRRAWVAEIEASAFSGACAELADALQKELARTTNP